MCSVCKLLVATHAGSQVLEIVSMSKSLSAEDNIWIHAGFASGDFLSDLQLEQENPCLKLPKSKERILISGSN